MSIFYFIPPLAAGFFGAASTIAGSYCFHKDNELWKIMAGIILYFLLGNMMYRCTFLSYNINKATITSSLVFLSQTVIIALWKSQ